MSAAYKCDRCFEFQDGDQPNVMTLPRPMSEDFTAAVFQLCGPCRRAFDAWWKDGATKPARTA